MSRLTDLIAQAKAKDPQLGADLDQEFKQLSSRLPFGLNFERHRPEAVELPQRPIRKGDKVRVLAPRGSTMKGDPRLWLVAHFTDRGHPFHADRGHRFTLMADGVQRVRVPGLIVSQVSAMAVKPPVLSTPARSAGVGNSAPKAMLV